MIGVAGGTASGKATVCEKLMEKLGQHNVNNVEKQVKKNVREESYVYGLLPGCSSFSGQFLSRADP